MLSGCLLLEVRQECFSLAWAGYVLAGLKRKTEVEGQLLQSVAVGWFGFAFALAPH
jgi:hypothetical protein